MGCLSWGPAAALLVAQGYLFLEFLEPLRLRLQARGLANEFSLFLAHGPLRRLFAVRPSCGRLAAAFARLKAIALSFLRPWPVDGQEMACESSLAALQVLDLTAMCLKFLCLRLQRGPGHILQRGGHRCHVLCVILFRLLDEHLHECRCPPASARPSLFRNNLSLLKL